MSQPVHNESCCGLEPAPTPSSVANRPGQSALRYRAGTHGRFKEAMLRSLAREPALAGLTTRADDDPTVALLDAWSAALDVLTFYQERHADEGFLSTARERRSVLELARAIGYELNPGVAASTWAVFTVEKTPGQEGAVRIEPGARIQSIPGQDELPQTFETVEAVEARLELNELRPRVSAPQVVDSFSPAIYLAGTDTGLQPGDRLLLVGAQRQSWPASGRWDARTVRSVTPVPAGGHTVVHCDVTPGSGAAVGPADEPLLFALRERASLFGFNAPDWRGLAAETKGFYGPSSPSQDEWPDFEIQTAAESRIDLDGEYEGVLPGHWVLLERPGLRELYRVEENFGDSRNDFGLTGKVTALVLDQSAQLASFPLRGTSVLLAGEALAPGEEPLAAPLFGDRIELDGAFPGIEEGRTLLLRGVPVEEVVVSESTTVLFTTLSGGTSLSLSGGERLAVAASPVPLDGDVLRWTLTTAAGVTGTVDAADGDLLPVPAHEAQEPGFEPAAPAGEEAEVLTVRRVEEAPGSEGARSLLVLEEPLGRVYRRATVVIYGNVAFATHGETRGEPLGSGDGGVAHQTFTLRQVPLTHVPAPTPSGGRTTLEVRVDGVAWSEVPSLHGQPADARVYSTRLAEDGTVQVRFGDGTNGSRLPTGSDNVEARLRVGTGLAGQVRAGQLSLLMSRPLGLKEVTNPLPATGAQDPETLDDARRNAPLVVLTLDRIVSVTDFEDFARSFAGIGKAQATVLWSGERRLVHVTVAGADGTPLEPGEPVLEFLRDAVDRARHEDQEVRIDSFVEHRFGAHLRVRVDAAHVAADVLEAVRARLEEEFSFARRDFAQGATASEVLAAVHDVAGVEAAVLVTLDGADPIEQPRLAAARAHWESPAENAFSWFAGNPVEAAPTGSLVAATLLTLDPEDLTVEELQA